MIQTRKEEEPRKEVKPGRLFRGSDCLNPNTESSYLGDSQYVGHFGTSVDFCAKLEHALHSYGDLKNRLAFINDGAAWIREWIADRYTSTTLSNRPLSISVLDFYHAMEYLREFADKAFPDAPSEKKRWREEQKELLLASDVDAVLKNIGLTQVKEEDRKK
jgi:hypothetical protein